MELRIKEFWAWFIDNEYQFREVTDTEKVVELLNNQVLDFGMFAWEIGVGIEKQHSFTISPNGNKDRLRLSRQIVKQAPELRLWEFNYCKPIRSDWDFTLEVFNNMLIKQTYDASKWDFVLEEEENQKIKILFCASNIATLDYDDLPAVGDLVVNNLLGEEMRTNAVHSVQFVDDFLPDDEDWTFNIRRLKQEFRSFLYEIKE